MVLLTIGIPTYNRAEKLFRLLRNIQDEITSAGLDWEVDVLVSDNASSDSTPEVLSSFKPSNFILHSVRQKETIWGELNFFFLYYHARSKYLWFFADDDILLPGSIGKVYNALSTYQPAALVFSFIQPPGTDFRIYNFSEPVKIINDPVKAIELVGRSLKASTYIVKICELSIIEYNTVEELARTTGWCFVYLSYTALEKSESPKVCIISEGLASSDEDYIYIGAKPEVWGGTWKVFLHPWVLKHALHLVEPNKRLSYYGLIQLMFAVKVKILIHSDIKSIDKAIADLNWHILWLVKTPKHFFQLILMKFHLIFLYSAYKRLRSFLFNQNGIKAHEKCHDY